MQKSKVTITITHVKADCSCSCAHGDANHEDYTLVSDNGGDWNEDSWCDGDYMENDAQIAAEERAEAYQMQGRETEIVKVTR